MSAPDRTPRRYTRLSDDDWRSVRSEWESGRATLADLADRYGVSIRSLQNHFADRGVSKGSAARVELQRALTPIRIEIPSLNSEPAANLKIVQAAALHGACEIEAGILEQIAIARADPTLAYRAGSAIKALAAAADALGKIHQLKRAALGLDEFTSEEIPVLEVRFMTDEDIAQLRATQEEADDNLGFPEVADDIILVDEV